MAKKGQRGGRGNKTPEKIKELQGYPNKRKNAKLLAASSPGAAPISRTPGFEIRLNKMESALYDRVTQNLEAIGLLTNLDIDVVLRYVKFLAKWYEIDGSLSPNGYFSEGHRGRAISADVNLLLRLNSEILKIEKEMGLTPAARSGMIAPTTKIEQDEFEEFMFGRMNDKKKKVHE